MDTDLGLSPYYYAVTSNNANLCTYFILPLIGLNVDTLRGNFRNCYLNITGDKIYVQVALADMVKKEHPDLPVHRCIILDWRKQYVEFIIPEEWRPDVIFFIQGQYSMISDKAKAIIKKDSTLFYNRYVGKSKISSSDYRLIALGKSDVLTNRRDLFSSHKEFEKAVEEHQELLSPPAASIFISI